MVRLRSDDIRRGWWMFAAGLISGGVAGFCFPSLCLFAVPLLGWVAGGGAARRPMLHTWPAAMLGLGAVGMSTLLSTFTFGWWPAVPRWIAYAFFGMSALYWALYTGMRWLHSASGQVAGGER